MLRYATGYKQIAALVGLTAALMAGATGAALAAPHDATTKPTVTVIGTGGTIAGLAASRVDFQTYKGDQLSAADLVKFLQPEVGGIANVESTEFSEEGANDQPISHYYYDLSKLVDERLKKADAVVVSAGTRTVEDLAYWLDLTVRSPKPVVVTGSERPWNVISSDGPANLYNAVALAASGRTKCFGTVVMLNDEILAARDATKTNTLRLDAFQGRALGVLGVVDERRIRLLHAPARVQSCGHAAWRTPFDLSKLSQARLPSVEIGYSYAGAGGEEITAFAGAGARGIVMAGDPSTRQYEAALEAIKHGVVFVAANRNISGAVYDPGVPGVVAAEDLLPQKARLLLMLSLALTGNVEQIQHWFSVYGVPQFEPTG
jgi:L-asparaginase